MSRSRFRIGVLALAAGWMGCRPAETPPPGPAAASTATPAPPALRVKSVADDPIAGDAARIAAVRRGAEIFNRTQIHAAGLGTNALACTNCHIDGGQKIGSLPLVGSERQFPQTSGGKTITLEDRIARCFTHSLAGKTPPPGSPQLVAVADYIRWLGEGLPTGPPPAWLNTAALPVERRIPLKQLNAERGRQQYDRYCSGCHGLDGQGYRERRTPLPYDYIPPVWGPRSYDDTAGLARVYTLAGFARHAMPWDDPGEITDRDAQEIAAFVNGQPRPAFPDKSDWDGTIPEDAVYDTKQYSKNPFFVPLDQ